MIFRARKKTEKNTKPNLDDPQEQDDSSRLTIFEHLDELRQRLIKSAIAVAIGAVLGFVFLADPALAIMQSRAGDVEFIAIEVTETLSVWMKIALYSGFAIAMPFVLYQAIMFVAPAMSKKEKRYFFLLLPAVVVSFIIGVAFGFYVVLPPALDFLLHFKANLVVTQPRLENYVSTVLKLLFWIGITFETPIVIFFLAKMHVVTVKMLSHFRRHAYIISFVLGAVITPTFDPVNQTLVALPLIILYELGILLARIAYRLESKVV